MVVGGSCGDTVLDPWDNDGHGETTPVGDDWNEVDVKPVACVCFEAFVENEATEFPEISVDCETFDAWDIENWETLAASKCDAVEVVVAIDVLEIAYGL